MLKDGATVKISRCDASNVLRRCDQYAKLIYRSAMARICMEDRFDGKTLQVGQTVLLTGLESDVGFIVDLIAAK